MSMQLPPVRIQFTPTGSTAAATPANGHAPGIHPAGSWNEGISGVNRATEANRSSGTVGADLFRRAFADAALQKVLSNCLEGLDDVI